MIVEYLQEVWEVLTALAPWLFLGAAIAALLKAFLPEGFISRHVGRPTLGHVVKAVVFGIPLPLCSCGVLPTAIGLRKEGASNGAAVGFLISTPQTGADSILVAASFLGWPLALFKVLAAFVTGVVGGVAVHWFDHENASSATEVDTILGSQSDGDCSCGCSCGDENVESGEPRWKGSIRYALDDLLGSVYRYIVVGVLIAALIAVAVPSDYFARYPALTGILGMVVMAAIAIPLYVCSTGSVPIAASLIHAGMPAGSALVFLMAGPATNIATIGSISRSFGRRITAIYLGTVLIGSIAFGLIFQAILGEGWASTVIARDYNPPLTLEIIEWVTAILLVVLFFRWSILDLHNWFRRRRASPQS